jgi:hypothetical protein
MNEFNININILKGIRVVKYTGLEKVFSDRFFHKFIFFEIIVITVRINVPRAEQVKASGRMNSLMQVFFFFFFLFII